MQTVHMLTDVYGPRLTGSPNHKAAAEWAIKRMTEWGLVNGHLEPWEFNHPGWSNERFSGFIVSPVKDSLVGEVLAWTPSTQGTVVADALHIIPPASFTREELDKWIDETRPKVKGRIVLMGRHVTVPVTIVKPALRRDYDELRRLYDATNPTPAGPPPEVGPAAAATILREAFSPFEDLGIMGATTTKSRRAGGTDTTSFNEAGLPGIGLSQDPIEYGTYTWHTNLDTFERIIEEDVKKSAIAIAAAVYHLAMRDEMLPRFSKEDMPPPPAAPPVSGTGQ
jgi:hypothetical protein